MHHNKNHQLHHQEIEFSNPPSFFFPQPSQESLGPISDTIHKLHLFSLVHFCEQSGPSIVFVTQTHTFASASEWIPISVLTPLADLHSNQPSPLGARREPSGLASPLAAASPPPLMDSPAIVISSVSTPPSASNTSLPDSSAPPSKTSPPTTACRTCYPTLPESTFLPAAFEACLDAFPYFATSFPKRSPAQPTAHAPTKFSLATPLYPQLALVSTRHPINQHIYPILKTACVRSLSCELTSHRSGPVYFTFQLPGYPQTYHTLSYHFQLSDATSRGNVRAFAFIYLTSIKEKAVAGWDRLIKNFSEMATELSSLAENVSAGHGVESASMPACVNDLTPQRFLKRRGAPNDSPNMQALSEMLGVDTVFISLHLHFSTLLRDTLFPTGSTFPFQPSANSDAIDSSLPQHFDAMLTSIPPSVPSIQLPTTFDPFFPPSMSSGFPPKNFNSDPLLWPSGCENVFEGLCRALGYVKLVTLLTHLVCGDQLIFRGDQRDSLPLANALALLLPKPCAHILVANTYRHSWECNLLCIDEHIPIPTETLKRDLAGYVLVDVEASSVFLVDAYHSLMYHETPKLAIQYGHTILSSHPMLPALTLIKVKWMHVALQYHFLHQVHMENFLKRNKERGGHAVFRFDTKFPTSPSSHSHTTITPSSAFSTVTPTTAPPLLPGKWWQQTSCPSLTSSVLPHTITTPSTPPPALSTSSSSSASSSTSYTTSSLPSLSHSDGSSSNGGISCGSGMGELHLEEDSGYEDVDLLVLRFWARTFRCSSSSSLSVEH